MTEQKHWKQVRGHSAYLPWRKWQTEWIVIEVGSRTSLEKAQWCCENIEGFFSMRNTADRTAGTVFFFDREGDAVAFKLRWL